MPASGVRSTHATHTHTATQTPHKTPPLPPQQQQQRGSTYCHHPITAAQATAPMQGAKCPARLPNVRTTRMHARHARLQARHARMHAKHERTHRTPRTAACMHTCMARTARTTRTARTARTACMSVRMHRMTPCVPQLILASTLTYLPSVVKASRQDRGAVTALQPRGARMRAVMACFSAG